VKTTRHFELAIRDRPEVNREWCERVARNPAKAEQQGDGRWRMWGYIEEAGKNLRVITLEDRETIDNAFFDRRYKGPR
jgi:hypothetical protein